eukprot:8663873-Prorocentrum_lima.AAC.1
MEKGDKSSGASQEREEERGEARKEEKKEERREEKAQSEEKRLAVEGSFNYPGGLITNGNR